MRTALITLVVLLCVSCVLAVSSFSPFSLERTTPTDNLETVKDKMNRNSDKTERKDRESQKWDNDHYPQYGDISSGEFAWDALGGWYEVVVYLPDKYATSTSYVVAIGRTAPVPSTPANQVVLRYTDSSFAVRSDTTGNGIMWQTIGVKKTSE